MRERERERERDEREREREGHTQIIIIVTEKTMEHENDGDTNLNWRPWDSHKRIGTVTCELGNKRTSGNQPNITLLWSTRILRRVLET